MAPSQEDDDRLLCHELLHDFSDDDPLSPHHRRPLTEFGTDSSPCCSRISNDTGDDPPKHWICHLSAAAVAVDRSSAARECMAVFVEMLQWPHCRPLRSYADDMAAKQEAGRMKLRRVGSGKKMRSGGYREEGRRGAVRWMLEASKAIKATMCATSQAVRYLDRFLAIQQQSIIDGCDSLPSQMARVGDLHVAGATCLWIALKMDDSDASLLQGVPSLLKRMEAMEARILHALQWRMLQVTVVDFTDSLLHVLASHSCFHIPLHLLHPLQQRAHEILQGVLLEVTFVGHELLVVAVCAIRYVLEEIMPLQAISLMHFIHEIVAPIDMEETKECYKKMGDLVVDPLNTNITYNNSSPDRVFQPIAHLS